MDKYPHAAGFVAGSETSQLAAESINKRGMAASQRYSIRMILHKHPNGLTGSQLTEKMDSDGYDGIQTGTVSARLIELERNGEVIKTFERRKNPSGASAFVYVLGNGTKPYPFEGRRHKAKDTAKIAATQEQMMVAWQKLRKECLLQADMILNASMYDFEAHLQGFING